ncbi:MAG: hypothetical protein NTV86_15115, partial [Planctomycetota bacterium]|nr:hypothetical protein [Planctomycetota bacterium]
MRRWPQTAFAVWLAACSAGWGQTTQPTTAPSPEIRELVARLGHKQWAVREEAYRKLLTIRDGALVPALREAAASSDMETALRAKGLLAEILDFTHVVVDALGEPIPGATVTLVEFEPGALRKAFPPALTANMLGGVTLPPLTERQPYLVWVHHGQFGQARVREPYRPTVMEGGEEPSSATPIAVPLVARNSPAYERAFRGQVVGPDGKGVARAEIYHLNQGFFGTENCPFLVLTDADGRFALYPPDPSPRHERGPPLIPLHSHGQIYVRAPGLFPYTGQVGNDEPAVIRLTRPERFHRFEFETAGGRVSGSEMSYMYLTYAQTPGGALRLDMDYLRQGGKLVPGLYTAVSSNSSASYLPLEVTKDSPEVLLFRLPPPVTYRGRVVDGVTGKPMPGAFVIAYGALDRERGLAMMTDADWKGLEALPPNPPRDAPALDLLKRYYVFYTVGRTDEQGRYEFIERRESKFTGLLAFARDRLPCSFDTANSGRTGEDKSPLCDLPLFPAARVTVQPLGESPMAIDLAWEFSPEGQPTWFDRFMSFYQTPPPGARIVAHYRLRTGRSAPVYVPA